MRQLLLSLLLFVFLAAPAAADKKPKLSAYFFPEDDASAPLSTEAGRIFRVGFKDSDLVTYSDVNQMLESETSLAFVALGQAQDKYAQAKTELAGLKPDKALGLFVEAFQLYVGSLSYAPDKLELRDLCLDMAKTAFLIKKPTVTPEIALRRALLLDPTWQFDADRLSPRMKDVFAKAQKELDNAPKAKLKIDSSPSFAEVYANGIYIGTTPLEASDLPAGENFISIRKDGYEKATMLAVASEKKIESISVPLKELSRLKLLVDAADSARVDAGTNKAAPSILEFREVFKIDLLVIGSAEQDSPGNIRLTAYLYDLRTKIRLNRVEKIFNVSNGTREQDLFAFAESILKNVDLSGQFKAPELKIDPPQTREKPAFYKRKAFLYPLGGLSVIGVVALIALSGIFSPAFDCNDGSCVGIEF